MASDDSSPFAVSVDGLTITVRDEPDTATVVLVACGEIDIKTIAIVQRALLRAIEESNARAVVLEVSGVEFMSSSALAVLVIAEREARMHHRCFQLVTGGQRSVCRPLAVAGLDRVVPNFPTEADALHARRDCLAAL